MQEAVGWGEGVVQVGMGVEPAKGKALRLQVQNFGLNEIRYTASCLRIKQMRGIRRRKIIVVRPMIKYVNGRTRGRSYQGDVQEVSWYC